MYEWTNEALNISVLTRAATGTPTTTVAFKPIHDSITATPNPVAPGQNTAITAAVKNTGGAGSALIDIEVYKDGVKVGQQFYDNQAFAANETKNFVYNWPAGAAGTYKVSVGIFKPGWTEVYSWNADVGTITVQSGTTPPPPTSAIVIYSDSLATSWENWSWDTATTMGAQLRVQYSSAWAGLFLHANSSVSTSGKTTLSFDINGSTSGNQVLQVYAYDQAGNGLGAHSLASYLPGGKVPANTWTHIDIPLSAFNAANKTITGIVCQGATGSIQAPYLIDNLQIK
jgi:hypothetical protein